MIFALHGNLGSSGDFAFLSDLDWVKGVDLWPWSGLSLKALTLELKRLAENHEERILLGYSMGGRIALQALAEDPDFWHSAIIISAHPGFMTEEERAQRRKNDQDWADLLRGSCSWVDFLEKWNAQSVLAGPVPPGQHDLEIYRANVAEAFENWSLGQQKDLRSRLQSYEEAVTWVVGGNDAKSLELGKEMASLLPRCELTAIPGCGHRVLLERPDVIWNLLIHGAGNL